MTALSAGEACEQPGHWKSPYSMIVTFIILKVYGSITNIKPKDEDVVKGLDSTLLDEKAYDIM